MKPILESCNINVVGSWNLKIFTPKWVTEKIVGKSNFKVEMGIGPATNLIRFSNDELIIAPQEDRIIITAKNLSDKTLAKVEETTIKILELLTHTPIRSFGFNFAFLEEEPENKLVKLFDLNDKSDLNNINDIRIQRTAITRRIEENGNLINLTISYENGNLSIIFNFHNDVKNAEEAIEKIKDKATQNKQTAFRYLKSIYNLEIDEEVE